MEFTLKVLNPSPNKGYDYIDDSIDSSLHGDEENWGKPKHINTGWGFSDFLPVSRVEEFTDAKGYIAFSVVIEMKP